MAAGADAAAVVSAVVAADDMQQATRELVRLAEAILVRRSIDTGQQPS
jgi:thiamine monophosphate synthase